jgi:predicted dehydrogenase
MSTYTDSGPPLKFGVLGCANIARQFIRDVRPSPQVRVTCVASRNAQTAATFAAANGVERSLGSYEALLADPAIDAIYLPLPNSLHAEWAIKAAVAGKHVLCEKPLALNRAEAEAMFDAARCHGVVLLESYPFWFQPQTGALVELLGSGALGTVRSVQACFGFTLLNPQNNIRLNPELGGGALLDAGSYALSLIRLAMGDAPNRVSAVATMTSAGVDISTMATLEYTDGRRAQLSCAMDTAYHRHATIVGSAGVIETEYLNHTSTQDAGHPYGYMPSSMRVRRGIAPTIAFEQDASPVGSGFRFSAEAFTRLVRERDFAAAARAAQASIDIAATLEAIRRSAQSGAPVAV